MNNTNNQIEMLDILNIMSFMLGVQNLNENLTQNDKQDMIQDLHNTLEANIQDIHQHLIEQDKKIDQILHILSQDRSNKSS